MKLWECLENDEQKNIFLISDGGSGKTYQLFFAYEKMKSREKTVALYIPLNKYDGSGDYVKDFILREFYPNPDAEKTVADRRDVLLSLLKTDGWRFCLFLDGINETSYSIGALTSEIEELSEIENVSTVVASRFDIDCFKAFKRFKLGKIDESFIEKKVNNYKTLNTQLKSLLKSPFYLTKYLEITDGEGITCAGELLTKYYESLVEKTGRSRKSCDYEEYCRDLVEEFLPNFAFERMEDGAYLSFNDEDLIRFWNGFCEKRIVRYPAIEDAERALKDLHVIVKAHEGYSFAHEIAHTYFSAKFVADSMKKNREEGDKLLLKVEGGVLQMVGELLGEHKTDSVDRLLDKYRGQFDGTSAAIVAKLIEMRKKVRGYNISGDYSNLDLTRTRFMEYNLSGSDFSGAKLDRLCFNSGRIPGLVTSIAYNPVNNFAYAVSHGNLYRIFLETGDVFRMAAFDKVNVIDVYGIEGYGEILVEYHYDEGTFFAVINAEEKIRENLLEIENLYKKLKAPLDFCQYFDISSSGKSFVQVCLGDKGDNSAFVLWKRSKLFNHYIPKKFRKIDGRLRSEYHKFCFINEETIWFYAARKCFDIRTLRFYKDEFDFEGEVEKVCTDAKTGDILVAAVVADEKCTNLYYMSSSGTKKQQISFELHDMCLRNGVAAVTGTINCWERVLRFSDCVTEIDFNNIKFEERLSKIPPGRYNPIVTNTGEKYLINEGGRTAKFKYGQMMFLGTSEKPGIKYISYLRENVLVVCDAMQIRIYKNKRLKKQLEKQVSAIDVITYNGKPFAIFSCYNDEGVRLYVYDYETDTLRDIRTLHTSPIEEICCYSPEGKFTTRSKAQAIFWDLENLGFQIKPGIFSKVAYLGDGIRIYSQIGITHLVSEEKVETVKFNWMYGNIIRNVAFVPWGSLLSKTGECGRISTIGGELKKANEEEACIFDGKNLTLFSFDEHGKVEKKEEIRLDYPVFETEDEAKRKSLSFSIAACDKEIAIYFNGEISFYDKKGNYKGKINPLVNTNALDADFRKAKLDPRLKEILEENGGKV